VSTKGDITMGLEIHKSGDLRLNTSTANVHKTDSAATPEALLKFKKEDSNGLYPGVKFSTPETGDYGFNSPSEFLDYMVKTFG